MAERDPIVDEIHAVREELLHDAGGDLAKVAESAKAAGDRTGKPVERMPPKRVPPERKAS